MSAHSYSLLVGGSKLRSPFAAPSGNVSGNVSSMAGNIVKAPGESGCDFMALWGQPGTQLGLARGGVRFVSTSGTIGAVVGGVSMTFASSGVNATDAVNMVNAVLASSNSLINPGGAVTGIGMLATNVFAEVSCGAVVAGDKLYLAGREFVAIPEGQTPQLSGQWTASTTDVDLHAANLARAINASSLTGYIALVDSAVTGSVFIFQTTPLVVSRQSVIYSNTSHIVVTAFAASNRVLVFPVVPGVPGNHVTMAATGTGVTSFGLSNARMSGGTGFAGFPLVQK